MRKQGTVIHWDKERAFGFIGGTVGADIFFKIRDFRGGPTPKPGLVVTFRQVEGDERGPRAISVLPATDLQKSGHGPDLTLERLDPAKEWAQTAAGELSALGSLPRRRSSTSHTSPLRTGPLVLFMTLWLIQIGWGVEADRLSTAVPIGAALLCCVTFAVYWTDKLAAQRGRWRTPEKTLHLLDLLGGWPGGWLAQRLLRHKSRKAAFRAVFWMTVVLHCAVLGAYVYFQPLLVASLN